ncbi:hypothetical protein [Mycoplasmopsis agalactiae]|uniref:Uncharacterized protein n=1 Tax=Mycoplasmopsis agalactiae TaxID=2110 RepID=D3VQJ1_MYCAA|nr:hypothetical protein [Mycoplasmopsis agalactiae]KAB6718311.1 hypothetical protein E4L58_03585 [Mycoplasmopsis agalactiae]CBH40585.1 Hypothetical protein, truncated in N terminal [Mycoplasmopsis agalactiae]
MEYSLQNDSFTVAAKPISKSLFGQFSFKVHKKTDIGDIKWHFVNYWYSFDEINETILKDTFITKNKEKLRELKINSSDLDCSIDNDNNKFTVNVMPSNKDFKGSVSFYFYVKNDLKTIKDKLILNLPKFDTLSHPKDYYAFETFIEKNSSKLSQLGLDKWDLKWSLENNLLTIKAREDSNRWKGEFSFEVYTKSNIKSINWEFPDSSTYRFESLNEKELAETFIKSNSKKLDELKLNASDLIFTLEGNIFTVKVNSTNDEFTGEVEFRVDEKYNLESILDRLNTDMPKFKILDKDEIFATFYRLNEDELERANISSNILEYSLDGDVFTIKVKGNSRLWKGEISFNVSKKSDIKTIINKFETNLGKFSELDARHIFETFYRTNANVLEELYILESDLTYTLVEDNFTAKINDTNKLWFGEISFKVYKKEDITTYLDKFVLNLPKFDDFSDNVIIKEFLNINKEIAKELNLDESHIKLTTDINDDYKKTLEIEHPDYIGSIKTNVYGKRNVNSDLKELINVFELKPDDKFDIDFAYKNFIEQNKNAIEKLGIKEEQLSKELDNKKLIIKVINHYEYTGSLKIKFFYNIFEKYIKNRTLDIGTLFNDTKQEIADKLWATNNYFFQKLGVQKDDLSVINVWRKSNSATILVETNKVQGIMYVKYDLDDIDRYSTFPNNQLKSNLGQIIIDNNFLDKSTISSLIFNTLLGSHPSDSGIHSIHPTIYLPEGKKQLPLKSIKDVSISPGGFFAHNKISYDIIVLENNI